MKGYFAIVSVSVIFMCRKISFLFYCIRIVFPFTDIFVVLSPHVCVCLICT